LQGSNIARMDQYKIEQSFPVVITPKNQPHRLEAFLENLHANKEQFHQLLLKHGALLFRGFPITEASQFSSFIKVLALGQFVNYIGGDSPRNKVEKHIYTSTEAPPSFYIPLHQELSFINKFPRHIYFYCDIAPEQNGETIIGDARQILSSLDAAVKTCFMTKKLTYTSRYYYRSKVMDWVNRLQRSHKSWIDVFETTDKKEVEQKCLENEFAWRWLSNDWLQIKQSRPAIFTHPVTNEPVWFNQAHLYDFNPRLLGWKKYLSAKLFYFRQSTRLHEVSFADNSAISRKDLYHIMDTLKKNTVAFPWKQNDVLVLDNILAMHGRAPFMGKRRILTAMTS
jgi:alpha-ketoglutarate-dependent taurine dioxygenase